MKEYTIKLEGDVIIYKGVSIKLDRNAKMYPFDIEDESEIKPYFKCLEDAFNYIDEQEIKNES